MKKLSIVTLALLALAGPSLAHEKTSTSPEATDAPALSSLAPPAAVAKVAERQREIYRILQGGSPVADADLADHLWRVAGSLATRNWTPPRVTVSVVVGG